MKIKINNLKPKIKNSKNEKKRENSVVARNTNHSSVKT